MERHGVLLAPSVLDVMRDITSRDDAQRIRRRLEALATMPRMGALYDPAYEAAKPPHEVRVTFAGHFGIYYTVDSERREVHVEYMEDARRDPLRRFR